MCKLHVHNVLRMVFRVRPPPTSERGSDHGGIASKLTAKTASANNMSSKGTTPQDSSPPNVDNEEGIPENSDESKPEKPRQWLIDRMFGRSPPLSSKPPCWICYVPPCISIAPDFFEQNCFCQGYGKIGCVQSELPGTARKRLLLISAFFNVLAICLTITACFSISTNFNILQAISFSSGKGIVTFLRNNTPTANILVDVGLQAVAYRDPIFDSDQNTVVHFDEFCNYNATSIYARFIRPSDCTACADVSDSLIFTLAISAFPYLPSLLTNFIRMYPNYDINCLKVFATLATAFGMGLSLYSFLAYRFECFFTFFEGTVYIDGNGEEVPFQEEAEIQIDVEWNPGNGLICIILATALMGIDIVVNLAIPSPDIARSSAMQEEYELQHKSASISQEVSFGTFIGAFGNMICGKNKMTKEQQDVEEGENEGKSMTKEP